MAQRPTQEQQAGGVSTTAPTTPPPPAYTQYHPPAMEPVSADRAAGSTFLSSAAGKNNVKTDNFSEFGTDLAKTVPTPTSTKSDINAWLDPYIKELTNIGPEYAQEMEYLKPYLSPEYTGETMSQVLSQSKANESPTGDKALSSASSAVSNALLNESNQGFGGLAKGAEQFAASVPYQADLQTALGYQKYLETYQGQNPNTAGWPEALKQALAAIGGAGNSTSGLPTTTQAATSLTNPGVSPVAASNLSGGGNG